ncbi:MAG TPA: carboxypeptidase-like regulatory domain-containing protein [Kofleriaceae bacterium]|nr:carboxypeptidase-like regulatory domain-containing protein [Kofleriaceae bacterium]
MGARTRVDLQAVQRVEGGLLVRGALMDVALEQPIPGHVVIIEMDPGGYRYAEKTGVDGSFRWRLEVRPGHYRLKVAGRPGGDYAPSPTIEREIDLQKRTPVVRLHAPETVSVSDLHLAVTLETEEPGSDLSVAGPIDLPVRLSVNGKPLEVVLTAGGRATYDRIEVHALGNPGEVATITARFPGDAQTNAAEDSRPVRVTTPTTLTLAAGGTELPFRGALPLSGQLDDARGPVAGASVGLYLLGPSARLLKTVTTDEKGKYRAQLDGGSVPVGSGFLEARLMPTVSWREPSHSTAVAFTALLPEARPIWFWLSPLGTLAALGLALLIRRRPWRKLLERRRAAQRARALTAGAGLTESKPRLLQALRPAHDHGISGQVCELPSGTPIPTAFVTVTAGGHSQALPVDDEGRFNVEELPAGTITVEVTAPGYVVERFDRTLPHRGELRRARVLLVPIRARIFEAYRRVTLPMLPKPEAAETMTPRELLGHMERKVLIVDELAALTSLVEVAYFGPRLPDAAVLAEAERLAANTEKASRAS